MNMANVNVEKLMKLQGDMTDAQFAKELGVSRTQLWRVRNGYSVPGPGFLQKFKARYPTERIIFSRSRKWPGYRGRSLPAVRRSGNRHRLRYTGRRKRYS